jgi:cholesterol transport system auxiliary component
LSPTFLKRRVHRGLFCAGLTVFAAACSSSPPATTYDLSAPRQVARAGSVAGQLAVAEPLTVQALEAERILVKDATGSISFLSGGQWSDRLPRLVQARLVQTFENASAIHAVARSGDRIVADYQLTSDIRAFQIDAATGEAIVEISAKVIQDRSGRIVKARVFSSRVPVGTVDAPNAAQGLDRALSSVLLEIVRWAGSGGPRLS